MELNSILIGWNGGAFLIIVALMAIDGVWFTRCRARNRRQAAAERMRAALRTYSRSTAPSWTAADDFTRYGK